MKARITEKRALLLKEWILSMYGNDERYYMATLYDGIPDGDDYKTVMQDLQNGFYDDDIDDTLEMYHRAKSYYGRSGWFINGALVFDENKVLEMCGHAIPEKIYIKR